MKWKKCCLTGLGFGGYISFHVRVSDEDEMAPDYCCTVCTVCRGSSQQNRKIASRFCSFDDFVVPRRLARGKCYCHCKGADKGRRLRLLAAAVRRDSGLRDVPRTLAHVV